MQSSEGFQYDGGPMNGGQPLPAGSRLNQYLANSNRQAVYSAPSFGPGTPINVNAPVFVPKHQQPQPPPPPPQPSSLVNPFAQLNIQDGPHQIVPFAQLQQQQQFGPMNMSQRPPPPPPPQMQQQLSQQQQTQLQQQYQQESRGGTTYFYPESHEAPQEEEPYAEPEIPEDTILVQTSGGFAYHAPLPIAHIGRFRGKANANQATQFISPELRMELINRQLAFDAKVYPESYPEIPQSVEHFSNLVPLENTGMMNQSQSTYKAFSCRDGSFYCLRRIHGFRVQHPGKQTQAVEQWKKMVHVNIVPLREILINSRAFDDSSLIFAYDYYPLAVPLLEKHFDNGHPAKFYEVSNGFKIPLSQPTAGNGVNESLLWNYIIQISSALRVIHTSGLACRTVDLTKIIAYGNKVMLSFCGIQDLVHPAETTQSIQQMQTDDLFQFGCVLMALACGRPHAYRKDLYGQSLHHIGETYSLDFKNVVQYLTQNNNGQIRKSINEILPLVGTRMYAYVDSMQARTDSYEAELGRELENGRLFRLLAKMNTVLERAEHGADDSWSETGDRYMLKLFRDYVFHQVTDQGKAWLDMAHIVQCLNKLDAGAQDKIEMVSRNGDTQVIIDYATLKRCLDKSFRDLIGTNLMQRH